MPIPDPFRRGLIAFVLLCAAMSSVALTLGRSRGVALVGRTLDVAIPLTLDSPGQAAELCAEADVFHGDMRVDASRVTTRVEPASGQNAVVRVRSSLPVDEPVVTVYLRLGCNQKITRRYVLLAEEPGEFVAPVIASPPAAAAAAQTAPLPTQALPPAPAAAAAAVASTGRGTGGPRAGGRSRRAGEAATTPRGAAAGKLETQLAPSPARSRPVARSAGRGGGPRLTVDLLDLAPERDPQLRSTAGLSGAPSTSEQVRAQAAALWRSINAQPEDVLRDIQRVQALETDMKGLRTLVAGNDRTLSELREQLNQARQERSLTLAAIALLSLLLAAMGVTWFLRRGEAAGSREWWRRKDPAGDAAVAGADPSRHPPQAASLAAVPAARDLRVDESMFESLKQRQRPAVATVVSSPARPAAPVPAPPAADSRAGPVSSFHLSFQPSHMASMRMVKAEELVDIQQQADFFMSLGQTEQAIDVLESHIHNNTETSALVWLDLLAIYRALKRRQDYELLRADFQRVFNAEVPAYDSTPTVSGGLEDYPRALTRITALWPSPKVMDVIEESIFRKPGVPGAEPFDLEAYRELVMLYNLGREVVRPESAPVEDWAVSEPAKSSFFETSMQPLSVSRDTRPPDSGSSDLDSGPGGETDLGDLLDQPLDLDSLVDDGEGPLTTGREFDVDPQLPRPSPRLGLDIDLTSPPEPNRHAGVDSNSVDFELSEPHEDGKRAKPGTSAE